MSQYRPITELEPSLYQGAKIAIVQAKWNEHITSCLTSGAVESLVGHGICEDDIYVYEVPGAVELTYAAGRLLDSKKYDAVIVFGCVIKGDTPHFDYVCDSATQGITELNSRNIAPVIFGVLTVDSEQQAIDRVGGSAGHKGKEAAETALHMIVFDRSINN